MNRLFGSSKKEVPPPSLTDAIQKVDGRVSSIDSKIKTLDEEIQRIKDQLAKLPPNSPSRDSLKQRAIRALQQRKLYEQQANQMRQQSFNMEQTAFATESLKDTQTTVQAMQYAAKDMKRQMRAIKADRVEDLQDELQELMENSTEIQELMGRSFVVPDGIDEADLEAELEALEAMDDSSYLDILPTAPTAAPKGTTPLTNDQFEQLEQPNKQ
jgi:charged multivesicular body protein 5